MDEQAFPVIIMHLALISVAGNGGQLCQQVNTLDQGLVYINIVRIVIVIIQGKDRVLKLIHQILTGKAQQVHFHELIRNGVAVPHHITELFQFSFLRQISEQQKETGFLIPEMALLLPLYQVQYIHAPVEKPSGNGLDSSVCLLISHYVGHPGKAYPHTGSVLIPEALLYIVLFIPFIRNIRVILRLPIKLCKKTLLNHVPMLLSQIPPSVSAPVIVNQTAGLYDFPLLCRHIRNIQIQGSYAAALFSQHISLNIL